MTDWIIETGWSRAYTCLRRSYLRTQLPSLRGTFIRVEGHASKIDCIFESKKCSKPNASHSCIPKLPKKHTVEPDTNMARVWNQIPQ